MTANRPKLHLKQEVCIYGIYFEEELLYVGQTKNHQARVYQHRYFLKAGTHHCKQLQAWFDSKKLSVDDLCFTLLEVVDSIEHLTEREEHWFQTLSPKFWGKKPSQQFNWKGLSEENRSAIFSKRSERKEARSRAELEIYGSAIREAYLSGDTLETISRDLELSLGVVLRVFHSMDLKLRKRSYELAPAWRKELTEEEVLAAVRKAFSQHGPKWSDVALALGASTTDARNWGARLGLYKHRGPRNSTKVILERYGKEELSVLLKTQYELELRSFKEIAQSLGTSPKVVKSLLEELLGYKDLNGKSTVQLRAREARRARMLQEGREQELTGLIREQYLEGDRYFSEMLELLAVSKDDFNWLLRVLPLGEIPDGRALAARKRKSRRSLAVTSR